MPVILVEQQEDQDAAGNITQHMHAQFTITGHAEPFDVTVPLTADWAAQLSAAIESLAAQVRSVYGTGT